MIDDVDEVFDSFEGQCQGCDCFRPLGDVGLCDECAKKLERDLIRERDWDYNVTAHGLSSEQREEIRRQVIAQFGESLELIAPTGTKKEGKRRKRKWKKHKTKPPR